MEWTNLLAISYKLLKWNNANDEKPGHPSDLPPFSTKQRMKRVEIKANQTEKFNSSTSKTPITCIFLFKLQGGKNKSCGLYFQALTVQCVWMSPQCCSVHTFPSPRRLCLPQLKCTRKHTSTQKTHTKTHSKVSCFSVVENSEEEILRKRKRRINKVLIRLVFFFFFFSLHHDDSLTSASLSAIFTGLEGLCFFKLSRPVT